MGEEKKKSKWNRVHINSVTGGYFDENGYDFQGYDRNGYDKDGYDRYGFNKKGIHKITGMLRDPHGYDVNHVDSKGRKKKFNVDKDGFKLDNIHILTGTRFGPDGFNKQGYDKDGYDREGYNRAGYNRDGFDRRGVDKDGFTLEGISADWGYDRDGYYPNGFHFKTRINKYTGGYYDKDGYDADGYNKLGFNRDGFNRQGKDKDGNNRRGFNAQGIHKDTNSEFGPDGINRRGFSKDGIHVVTNSIYDTQGFDIQGFDEKGFDKNGFDKEGYDRRGFNKYGINREGINEKTGEADERVLLAEEFIAYGKSVSEFAEFKKIKLEDLSEQLRIVKDLPSLKDKLKDILSRNTRNYLAILRKKKDRILSGKVKVRDATNVDAILKICSPEEKKLLEQMIVGEITSHSLRVMQYVRMFDLKPLNTTVFNKITSKIQSLIYIAVNDRDSFPKNATFELRKENFRLNIYKTPYIPTENERIGFIRKPEDRQPEMFEITDAHRDMARRYLYAIDEFPCGKTMRDAFFKIAKGELEEATIARMTKERELKRLIRKNNELGDSIEAINEIGKAGIIEAGDKGGNPVNEEPDI